MKTSTTLRTLLSDRPQPFALPREVIGTDRVLQRWAVSVGSGLPTDEWDDNPKAKPPPLPDEVAIIVDKIVLAAPPKTETLIMRWYKSPDPAEVIGKRIGVSPSSVYRALASSLYYMRDRFESSGDLTLCRLIRIGNT